MPANPRKVKWELLAISLILMALTGCAGQIPLNSSTGTSQFNIGESDVTSISIAPVEKLYNLRIVALANGSAEIISAMGLEPNLVGRDIASTNKTLDSIPVVTSGHQVIPEKIIALHPDLVITDASTGPASAISALRKSGIIVKQISEAWNLADISKKVSVIGKVIGAPKSAELLNLMITNSISESKIAATSHPRIAFLYLRGTSSIYLMGGPGSGADSLIAAIGAIDVGAISLPRAFNSLTSEALVATKPDILLVMTKGLQSVGGIAGLVALPGVGQTPAGKNQRIISVDDSLLLSFGPRTPSLLALLAKQVAVVMAS